MSSHSEFEKSYPSVIHSEAEMFDDLELFLRENHVAGCRAQDVKLCVSEAFNNATLHGNRLNPARRVKLRLSVNADSLVADIIDEGQGGIANIEKRREPGPLDETGRGMDLIYGRADDVILSAVDSGGLSVRLIFSIHVVVNKTVIKNTTC